MADEKDKKTNTEKRKEDEVEILMTDRQYIEHKWFQGRFFGYLSAIAGTLSELLRVVISRLIFNQNERLNLAEIYKRNLRTDTEKETEENKKGQEKENEEKKDQETGIEDKAKDSLSPETRDRVANLMFHENGVRKAFGNIGIGAQPEQNAPNVYLFKTLGKDQGGLQSTVYVMPKEDLIMGKADALASALYAYGEGDKIDCALKSLITVGAVRYFCDQPLFEQGQTSGKPVTLAQLDIKTLNGLEQMSLRASRDFKDAVEVIVNGEKTAVLTLDALKGQRYADYRDELYFEVDKKMNPTLTIGEGNTLTISRSHDGMSILYTEKDKVTDLGCYTFKTEEDVRSLMEEMKEANVDIRVISKEGSLEHMDQSSAAYVIGVISNPDMQPDKADGEYLNTFTGAKEPEGISHLSLERSENGVRVELFHPSQEEPEHMSQLFEYRNFSTLSPQEVYAMVETVEVAREMGQSNEYISQDYSRNDLSDLVSDKESAFHEPIIGANASEVMEQYETDKVFDEIEEPSQSQDSRAQETWKDMEIEPFELELDESQEHRERDVFDNFKEDDPITCTDDPRMLNDPDYIRMQEEEWRQMEENEAYYQDEKDYEER